MWFCRGSSRTGMHIAGLRILPLRQDGNSCCFTTVESPCRINGYGLCKFCGEAEQVGVCKTLKKLYGMKTIEAKSEGEQ